MAQQNHTLIASACVSGVQTKIKAGVVLKYNLVPQKIYFCYDLCVELAISSLTCLLFLLYFSNHVTHDNIIHIKFTFWNWLTGSSRKKKNKKTQHNQQHKSERWKWLKEVLDYLNTSSGSLSLLLGFPDWPWQVTPRSENKVEVQRCQLTAQPGSWFV